VFNLQGSEIIVILLLALVILGPEKLPDAVRKFAQTYGELKKMGTGFQSELRSVLDEPIREMKETARLVQDAADPKKIAEEAAEDSALREAAKSAERAAITDVPITEAALETVDPVGKGTTPVDVVQIEEAVDDEPDDGPPVIVNQIAMGNARGPVEPIVPEVLVDEVDNVHEAADQAATLANSAAKDADVTAG
jgi:sec-independent protein translocase protein TatB|tara:strand:+ start:1083 stop:1664 length:582 start_codon:yes stop_codon:yes gene_type:complete